MTLEQFEAKLKELLRKAEKAGLDPEKLCEIAEFILGDGWRE